MANNFFKVRNGVSLAPGLSAPPANPVNGDIYYDTTLNAFQRFQNGAWGAFGSGSGSGGVNYLATPVDSSDFESDIGNWVAYADAAGTKPVDGTGGSPVTTITRSASSPLRGIGSGLITKDAANRQGEGVSVNFTIDRADEAKLLSVQFDYIVASGSFQAGSDSLDSDLEVWAYDVTNAVLIPVTPFKLVSNSSITPGTFKGVFQTNSNSTSYRLILHIATTNAAAWTFKFDNASVGPQTILNAPSVTDWSNAGFPANGSAAIGFTTITDYRTRRIGSVIEIQMSLLATGDASTIWPDLVAGQYLPGGLSVDTSQFVSEFTPVGEWAVEDTGTVLYSGVSNYQFSTGDIENLGGASGTFPLTPVAAGDRMHVLYRLPILGWSSNTLTGNDADARVVSVSVTAPTTTSISSGVETLVNFGTTLYDTHGAWNVGTSTYTIPVSGIYIIMAGIEYDPASWNAGVEIDFTVKVNGVEALFEDYVFPNTTSTNASKFLATSKAVKLVAGDQITVTTQQNSGGSRTISSNNVFTYLTVTKASGPALPLESETVAMAYFHPTAFSLSTSPQTITFNTKAYDTHGAFNTSTGLYTVPISGKYRIAASIKSSANSSAIGDRIKLVANGGGLSLNIDQFTYQVTGSTFNAVVTGTATFDAVAGSQINLQIDATSNITGSIVADDDSIVMIERVK